MSGIADRNQLKDFLLRRRGLKFGYTPSDLAILDDPDLATLLFRDGEDDSASALYLQGAYIRRICLVFSMTEFRARDVDAYGERCPLSPEYLYLLEYEIEEHKKRKEECRHDKTLRALIKFLLTARRDYLVDHPEETTSLPSDMLVRMIHSCLLQFKWRSLKGFNVPQEDGERWLDFEIEQKDAIDTLKSCNEHRWDNNHPAKGLDLHD